MDTAGWLRGLGLGEYEKAFRDNDIDEQVLRELTADDLVAIGVVSVGHRRRLLAAIAALRESGAPVPSAATSIVGSPASSPLPPSISGEAERRQLTVMFCDLVGSTPMSSRLDPEDLREVIGSYHRCVADEVSRFDGFIAKYMGDGVLIYFGYPQAHEDDAERAVRTALALVDAVGRIEASEPLQVRIGIATGLVVVGDLIGAGEAQERGVVGETPNLAARLQNLAEPNAVVIAAATQRLSGRLFDYLDLGDVALAGFAEPVRAWRVLAASDAESRFEARYGTSLTPLVGREAELALLLDRWQQALEGEGRVVLLTGEAGIGKSRLARALLERLADEPHLRLRFFCSQYHQDSVLFPTREQLARAAGFSREDDPGVKLDKLEALLARADPEPEAIGLIAELLSLPAGSRYPVAGLTPQQRKEKIFEALVAQMAGLSAQQPVLMLFEDVHWIDPTSLELLSLIIERAQRLRVFLLITARPEFTPPWSAHAHVMALSLSRMSRREGAALVERITAGKALPRDILDRILARTDGVPLFVEELTKSVLESGVLVDTGDRYRLTGPLSPLTIPATLHDSLTARLDRLAPVREVAQISACIGRDFDYGLLAIVSAMPEDSLRSALEQLQRAELVIATGLRRGQVYRFKHALVRDAAYAGILRSRRALFHRSIADALERAFPEVLETQPEVVAHHLMEAGLPDKAVGYWFRAGKNAAARSANLEAIAHLRRGIEALTSLQESRTRDRNELDFQHMLGPCLIATQGPISGAALETFARARELCERLGDAPEYLHVMNWMAIVRGVRGELPQSLEAIEAATPLAETRGDRPALVNSLRGAGLVLLLMGRLTESRDRTERAVATFAASSEDERLAARAAGQDAGVASLAVMSWALWALGSPDTATARSVAALERAEAIGDPHSEAYARYYASILSTLLGEPATAQRHAERCLALSEEHGFQWRALARMVAGISAQLIDPSSGSLDQVRAELDEYGRRGYQLGITVLYVLLCEALLLQCDTDAAMTVLAQGFETTRRNDERIVEAEMNRLKGRAIFAGGRAAAGAEAQSALAEALAIAQRQSARSLELRASRDLAQIWLAEGRRAEARDLLAPVYHRFTEGFDTPDLKEAKALLEELA